jgi:predicted nucleic acid-binding protein
LLALPTATTSCGGAGGGGSLIAATAIVEGMTLVTADTRIRQSKVVDTVW